MNLTNDQWIAEYRNACADIVRFKEERARANAAYNLRAAEHAHNDLIVALWRRAKAADNIEYVGSNM